MNVQANASKSLKSRVIKGGIWTIGGYAISQVIRLASNLIMTRLLVPELFGLMALVQVVLYIFTLISDIGIEPSIIRSKRGNETVFLNTAWTLQVIKGTIIFLLGVALALFLHLLRLKGGINSDIAFANPLLPFALLAMSFTSLIRGFSSSKMILARRNLELHKITVVDIACSAIGLIVMVSWAWIDRSIWALVAGAIISCLLRVISSHIFFTGNNNRFAWEKKSVSEVLHFGKWILVSSIITAFVVQGDRLILGSLVSAEELGIYTVAYFLFFSGKELVLKVNSVVFLSAFGEVVRDRPSELKNIYYRARKISDLTLITLAGFLFVAGDSIVALLYDDRYAKAGNMLEILALALIFTGIILSRELFLSIGKPKYNAFAKAFEFILLFSIMPLSFHYYGMEGLLISIIIVAAGMFVFDLYLRYRNGFVTLSKEFRMFPMVFVGYCIGLLFNNFLVWSGLL